MSLDIASIEINYTQGLVGLDISDPEVSVQQTKDNIQLNQQQDRMEISAKPAELETSSYPSRADMGYLNISDRKDTIAREGQQTALQAIAKYANEGDQLADFQNFDISDLARQNSRLSKQQLEIGYKRGPEHTYIPGQLDINHQGIPVQVTTERAGQANKIGVNLQRGNVNSYLLQEPGLEITAPGVRLNILG
ncbi:MAG: DUF6470 family protein [Halarsenatibacteraceae bacterium]